MNPPQVFRLVSKVARYLAPAILALGFSSCVQLVTSEQAAVQPAYKGSSPMGLMVVDQRQDVAGGLQKDRYMGRCRLGLYGIPTPVIDPKHPFDLRVQQQLQAGFEKKGVEVVVRGEEAQGASDFAGSGARKILVIRINDATWIDFANPMTGNESILYFDGTAEVLSPTGSVLGRASHKIRREFKYDANDSLFNQALWTFQPEFQKLVNQPAIRSALTR